MITFAWKNTLFVNRTGSPKKRTTPLATITTNPPMIHGSIRFPNSETGVSVTATPSRRRSRIIAMPRNRHNESTWTDSTPGYM